MSTYDDSKTVHFFWHGSLSQLEVSCITSFKNHGFKPILWSYTNISIDNIKCEDASKILSIDHLTKYSQANISSNLAAFSDVFRIHLLNKYNGWWCDTDCYCLKDYDEFSSLNLDQPIIVGYESEKEIGCGVLRCTNEVSNLLLNELIYRLNYYNNNIPKWGLIGPALVYDVIIHNNLLSCVLPSEYFYPISYHHNYKLFYSSTVSDIEYIRNKIKQSFILHLWHEKLRRANINKHDIPPTSSAMYNIYHAQPI